MTPNMEVDIYVSHEYIIKIAILLLLWKVKCVSVYATYTTTSVHV